MESAALIGDRLRAPEGGARLPSMSVGVSYKHEHFDDICRERPDIGFFEVHAENFMGSGGEPHARLERLRRDFPLSLHGVGLSIGGRAPLVERHLDRLKRLVERYEPALLSEHLAWSTHGGRFYNDLLPFPYTRATLTRVAANVQRVQETLGRRILIENPATYIQFAESDLHEAEFLAELARRTGCGLLLDVANIFVSAMNHDFDACAYLDLFPMHAVEEIHLAGYHVDAATDGEELLIDSHSAPVAAPVWRLYETVLGRSGPIPTLIEWDNHVPPWPVLLGEAQRAATQMRDSVAAEIKAAGGRHAAWR